MALHFRPLDDAGARQIAAWRYEPPSIYQIELSGEQLERGIAFLIDPANCYYRIDGDDGLLEAFCCYGYDAQVDGGDYRAEALDIGMGVHPDLTGQGRGYSYALAIIAFGMQIYQPHLLRVTVADSNLRSQRVWQRAGFTPSQYFHSPNSHAFTILTRSAEVLHDPA